MNVTPRLVGLLGLVALLPVVAFVVLKSEPLAAVALVNVVLITASLAVALSPHDAEEPHTGDRRSHGGA